jgi:hypothetical protein
VLTAFEERPADVDQGLGPALARSTRGLGLVVATRGQAKGGGDDLAVEGLQVAVQAPTPLQERGQVQAGLGLLGLAVVEGVLGQRRPGAHGDGHIGAA